MRIAHWYGRRTRRAELSDLESAALKWWKSRRPVDFDLEDHLANPTINCTGSDADKELALAVSKIAAKQKPNRAGKVRIEKKKVAKKKSSKARKV